MGEPRNFTRRALLGGVAAAGAASLARPAGGLAAVLEPPPGIASHAVGSLSGVSRPIQAPRPFALAGIEWVGPRSANLELRARTLGGRWTPWVPGSTLGHDPDGGPGSTLFGEPVWTGPADQLQLRTDEPVRGLRAHFVTPPAPRGAARATAGLPLAQPVFDAGAGQPPVIARNAWAQGQAPPSHAPVYATIKLAFVHHTQGANGYSAGAVPSILLGIFQYHRYVRGYWDIAYNFLIDDYGRIWEGRAGGIDSPVQGAHAGGYNAESTGVAVLGDFTNLVPPPPALDALERLLAWKLSLHGVPAHGNVTVVVDPGGAFYTPFAPGAHVSLPRVAGHRDGDSTDCPGSAFYARLPSIRPRVSSLAGVPARVTIGLPGAGAIAGQPATVAGRLHPVGSRRGIAGAPIEVQRLRGGRRMTLATATTASDGSWSAAIAPRSSVLVRALHRPAPATVSDWILLAVAPLLTLSLQSVSPLRFTGTVAPAKPQVTIELRRGATVVRSRRLPVRGGRFAGSIRAPRPGRYTLVALTAADAENAAGASTGVPVIVS